MFPDDRIMFISRKWLLIALLALGIVVSSIPAFAEEKEPTLEERMDNAVAGHTTTASQDSNIEHRYSSSNIKSATQNKVIVNKSISKLNKYILFFIALIVVIIILVNLFSISSNARHCSYCKYTGHMRLINVESSTNEKLILFMTKIFPLLLYFYAEQGRFLCPRCHRSSANTAIRSML